ncbi:MFS transporter [Cryptosporangium phraense]|uniref:MFS transporter n=2 Tax=Cryptosporangium phraense TaxID=2593070 RepID=A0A545AMB2_9ACTN|nr:MFS transporter [Cryptosporangium phraense]
MMTKAIAALVVLSTTTFMYVTTETLPIGLLPLIANDLGVSRSAVGLLVTGYGLVVVVASVPLTALTRRWNRKWLLTGLVGLLVVTTLMSALAGNYWVLLSARLITALGQALFWSIVTPTAFALFPAHVRGRAASALAGGSSLAAVLGVPIGTWLGQQAGWQVAFLAVCAFGIVLTVGVAMLLPTAPGGTEAASRGTEPDTGRFWVIILTTVLGVTGAFTAFTYISAFLTDVNGFSTEAIGPILFVRGIAGVVGVALVSLFIDRAIRATLTTVVALQGVGLALHYVSGDAQWLAIGSVALGGLAFSGMASVLGVRVLQVAPRSTELASASMSTGFNVGITAGALIGGLLLPTVGVRSTALVGVVLTFAALAVLLMEPYFSAAEESDVRALEPPKPLESRFTPAP